MNNDLISRQAVIKAFSEWRDDDDYDLWQVIDSVPAVVQCEDAVSRKDCLQALSHLIDVEGFRSGWAVSRANVECMLKAMPSVMPKQRTGKWLMNDHIGTFKIFTCDKCGWNSEAPFNFCPNCGDKKEIDVE